MKNPSGFVKLFSILIWFLAFEFFAVFSISQASCRTLEFRTTINGKALTNHTIRTIQPIRDDKTCKLQCYLEPLCFAVNFCQKDGNEAVCELTNSVAIKQDQNVIDKQECTIYSSESSCSSFPCAKNASCHGDFLDDPVPFKCICPVGFTGRFCETDIDECAPNAHFCHVDATCINFIGSYNCTCKTGYQGNGKFCQEINECTSNTHNCHPNAACSNTIGGFTCTCKPGLYGNGTFCQYPKNCEEIEKYLPNPKDGYHDIKSPEGTVTEILCVFSASRECGSGHWTLALKIDGSKTENGYSSAIWKSDTPLNPGSYKIAFENDSNDEIKLPAYWSHPVTKLCLGMRYSDVVNWISVNIRGPSLVSLFKSEQTIMTDAGRGKWVSLFRGINVQLQQHCNLEGINVKCHVGHKARIGFLGNNEKDCNTCDTSIGFGLVNGGCVNLPSSLTKTPFCFILVQ